MRPDRRLGLWRWAPRAWTSSPRRRRLAFVVLAAPGVMMAVAGAQWRVMPAVLSAGVAWVILVFLVRGLSEPRFAAIEAARNPDPVDAEETAS